MTPDFLRGETVAQIIGTMHNAHVAGTWSVIAVDTQETPAGGRASTILFAVGTIYPSGVASDPLVDNRARVLITVEELPDGAS